MEHSQQSFSFGDNRSFTIDNSKPTLIIKKDQIITPRDGSLNESFKEIDIIFNGSK